MVVLVSVIVVLAIVVLTIVVVEVVAAILLIIKHNTVYIHEKNLYTFNYPAFTKTTLNFSTIDVYISAVRTHLSLFGDHKYL